MPTYTNRRKQVTDWLVRKCKLLSDLDGIVDRAHKTYVTCRQQYYPGYRSKIKEDEKWFWRELVIRILDAGMPVEETIIEMVKLYGPNTQLNHMNSDKAFEKLPKRMTADEELLRREIELSSKKVQSRLKFGAMIPDVLKELADTCSASYIYAMATISGLPEMAKKYRSAYLREMRDPTYSKVYSEVFPELCLSK